MENFFEVTDLNRVLGMVREFRQVSCRQVPLAEATGRVLAEDLRSESDLPPFARATMDGYAVRAASTFGAGEGNPAFLDIRGTVSMGTAPDFDIGPGQAARISTGGMLPAGADSVVMVEHTEELDDRSVEVCRSSAPGQNVIEAGEDAAAGQVLIPRGQRLRPQDTGLLAALGHSTVPVFDRPRVAIISSGDEIVPVHRTPGPGQIRDVNTQTLTGLALATGARPKAYGIVADDLSVLVERCRQALEECDTIMISGGSSVGQRDYTTRALQQLPDARILVHGISISPGKPTILARAQGRPLWGLPGQVVSAMVVFNAVVRPFIEWIGGVDPPAAVQWIPARISRNVASAQGRVDFIRVRLRERRGRLWADPVLGKSGLLRTMVAADGLVAVDINAEGLDEGTRVSVLPF